MGEVMTDEAIDITELLEIDPSRVDAVGKPANGTEWLMFKSIDGQIEETEVSTEDVLAAIKADDSDSDDRPDCSTCKGDGKIMGNNRKCPKCLGSGKQPKVGDSAKATAPSGVATPPAQDCPTCNGGGNIDDDTADGRVCPDCNGTGKDGSMPPADKLNMVDGFAGSSDDGNGRTTIDKALADYEELVKAKYKQADRDKMASSGQAMSDGAYPIADGEDLDNAIHAVGRGGASHNAIRKHIMGRAKALNLSSKIPDNWQADGSLGKGVIEKDGVTSGPNPFLGGSVSTDTGDGSGPSGDTAAAAPGSPDWEAMDAQIATDAANALLSAAELIRQFKDRESIEVAAGEGNDVFDTFDADCALQMVTSAIGIIATLAFHEGVAAQKAAADDEAVKSGARLSVDTISALVSARNVLEALLGDDDPENDDDDDDDDGDDDSDSDSDDDDDDDNDDDGDSAKSLQKDVLDMTPDDLEKLVTTTVVKAVSDALKGMPAQSSAESIANAKTANNKAKKKSPKDDMKDLEDEADQGDNDSASSPAMGAAKEVTAAADLTPEEIEANAAAKTAKKEAKRARKAAEEVTKQAEVARLIEEKVAKATEQVDLLKGEIETMKGRLVPGGPTVRRPQEAINKAAERDVLDLEVGRLERAAKETTDPDLRKGYLERAKEARVRLSEANKS